MPPAAIRSIALEVRVSVTLVRQPGSRRRGRRPWPRKLPGIPLLGGRTATRTSARAPGSVHAWHFFQAPPGRPRRCASAASGHRRSRRRPEPHVATTARKRYGVACRCRRPRGRAPRAGGRGRREAAPSLSSAITIRTGGSTVTVASAATPDSEATEERSAPRRLHGRRARRGPTPVRVHAPAPVVSDLDSQPAPSASPDVDRPAARAPACFATFVGASATMK